MPDIGISTQPIGWGDLANGDSGFYYSGDNLIHIMKFDDSVYESTYGLAIGEPSDVMEIIGGVDVTEDGLTSGSVEWFSSEDAIGIVDGADVTRVLLGHVATNVFGMEIYNAAGTAIAKFYGGTNEIAGWTIDTNNIIKTASGKTIELSTASDYPFFRVRDATYNYVTAGYINSTQVGLQIRDNAGALTFSALNNTATTIGGWTVGANTISATNVLLDATSGSEKIRVGTAANHVRLDGVKDRVAISASSADKVAMGFLSGLQVNKVDGTVETAAYASNVTVITDTSSNWVIDSLNSLTLHLDYGGGSTTDIPAGITITDSDATTMTFADTSGAIHNLIQDGTTSYWAEYGAADYGFWVKESTSMVIDGDITYDAGDWLVSSDGNLRFKEQGGGGNEVMRLGNVGVERGLFIANSSHADIGSAVITAKFTDTGFQLGTTGGTTQVMKFTTAEGLSIHGSINVQSWAQIGSGINLVPAQYIAFEGSILPETHVIRGAATLDTTSIIPSGIGNTLLLTASDADCYCYLSSSATAYNIAIEPDQEYILSFYTKDSVAGIVHDCYLVTNESDTHLARADSWTGTLAVQRVQLLFDLTGTSHDASDGVIIRVDNDGGAGHLSYFGGFMLEKSLGATGDNQASPLSFSGDLPLTYGVDIDAGGITFGTGGNIKGGQTAYGTGTGFFLGYEASAYKFSIGDATNYIRWSGTNFSLGGTMTVTGDDTENVLGASGGVSISGGGITLSTGAVFKAGKTSYGDVGNAGWWLGVDSGTPKFIIGEAGSTEQLTWDGATLAVRGTLDADDLTSGTFSISQGGGVNAEDGSGGGIVISNSDGATPLMEITDGVTVRVKIGRIA